MIKLDVKLLQKKYSKKYEKKATLGEAAILNELIKAWLQTVKIKMEKQKQNKERKVFWKIYFI